MRIDFRLRLSNAQISSLKEQLRLAEATQNLDEVKKILALLAYSEGEGKKQIAEEYGVSVNQVQSWIKELLLNEKFKVFTKEVGGKAKPITKSRKNELKKYKATSMFVHDIRKPFAQLKSILASFDHFKTDPSKLQAAKDDIERSMRVAEAMISDILDFTRNSKLETRPESLGQLFDFVIRQVLLDVEPFDISFRYSPKAKFKPLMDKNRLARALTNILLNALEAIVVIGEQTKGEIWVKTKETRIGKMGTVEIVVGNNGPALPQQVVDKMFNLFFTSGKRSGTGLGLASAHKIIGLHGGEVGARNLPQEKGVEFMIKLPASGEVDKFDWQLLPKTGMEIWEESRMSADSDPEITKIIEKEKGPFKVLLLEDDVLYRIYIRNLIEENSTLKGLLILYDAATISEAKEILGAQQIALAIIDIHLGDEENGLDFLKTISPDMPELYIMIHSNQVDDIDSTLVQQLNVNHLVQKPMTAQNLIRFLAAYAEKRNLVPQNTSAICCFFCDDSEIMRIHFDVIVEAFTQETGKGIDVKSYENGESLLAAAQRTLPDLVFTDLNLERGGGVIDGFQIIQAIKKQHPNCIVYLLTNEETDAVLPECVRLGGDGALRVPLSGQDFRRIMARHFSQQTP